MKCFPENPYEFTVRYRDANVVTDAGHATAFSFGDRKENKCNIYGLIFVRCLDMDATDV